MINRTFSLLGFLLVTYLSTISYAETAPDSYDYTNFDRSTIPVGEKLKYNAYILGKLLPMGTAELEVSTKNIDGQQFYSFHGTANGGYLFFTVNMFMESLVDFETLRPHTFIQKQEGFERRIRKLSFDWDKKVIVYEKKSAESDDFELRSETPIEPLTRDILSTLYFARNVDPRIGYYTDLNLIEKRKIWHVKISVVDKKVLTIDEFQVPALKVSILPINFDDNKRNEVFEGLFGLKGEIILWVSEENRIPLLIEGAYPLGIFDLNIKVVLTEWSPKYLIGADESQ